MTLLEALCTQKKWGVAAAQCRGHAAEEGWGEGGWAGSSTGSGGGGVRRGGMGEGETATEPEW